jgi:hypothetical protein
LAPLTEKSGYLARDTQADECTSSVVLLLSCHDPTVNPTNNSYRLDNTVKKQPAVKFVHMQIDLSVMQAQLSDKISINLKYAFWLHNAVLRKGIYLKNVYVVSKYQKVCTYIHFIHSKIFSQKSLES